jgi:hypothetical protein
VSAAEVGSGVGVVARDLLAVLAPLVPVLEDVGLGVRRLGAHAHHPNPRSRLRLLRRGSIARRGRAQVGTVGEDGVQRAGQPPVLLAHPPQLLLEALGLSVGKQWSSAAAILMQEWFKGTVSTDRRSGRAEEREQAGAAAGQRRALAVVHGRRRHVGTT